MKKLAFLFMLSSSLAFGQMGSSKKDETDEVKIRTLIVVVEEADPGLLKVLNDEEKAFYADEIKTYNSTMTQLMPKYWTFSSKVEFKTRSQVDSLVKAKSTNYAYLEDTKFTANYGYKLTLQNTLRMKDGKSSLLSPGDIAQTALCVRLTDNKPFRDPVYGVYLPSVFITPGGILYALKAIQLHMSLKSAGKSENEVNKMYKDNAKNLSNMTLEFESSRCKLSDDDFKKSYPYPYKAVSAGSIDSAIVNQQANTAVVLFVPRAGGAVETVIVDANEGKEAGRSMDNHIGSFDAISGTDFGSENMGSAKHENQGTLNVDDLKDLVKESK